MVAWVDGYLGSVCESDEDLRLLWEEKKNLSIFKSMFSYFIHAAVMLQQIQQQLEAVSCHSINCSKWMSSRRLTESIVLKFIKYIKF